MAVGPGRRDHAVTAPRAALYARVSTDEQSPDLQVEELRRLAEQRGWSVVCGSMKESIMKVHKEVALVEDFPGSGPWIRAKSWLNGEAGCERS